MAGRRVDVLLTPPETPRPRTKRKKPAKAGSPDLPAGSEGIEALREWRRLEAARRAVPAFVVFHDRTLRALAAARPSTLEALREIPGIGPAKLEAYGRDLLAFFGSAQR